MYERIIDKQTHQEQLDKLREEIALAEIEERDARIQELDIEAAVNFGEVILLLAPRLWVDHPSTKDKSYSRHCFLSAYNLRKVLIEPPKLA